MNNKNRMRFSVLVVLILAVTFSFSQNNDLNHGVLEKQVQVVPVPNQNFGQQPTGDVIINNNYPQQYIPVQPRPIYNPSRRKVVTPAEPAKKDTVYIVSQLAVHQSSFLSENGIIWCIIVLGLLLVGVVGYLIGRPKHGCYGNCNGCRGGNCGSRDINVQGHIDHGHNGIPTKVTHTHTHSHTGIPTEITLKAEIPPKVEDKPVEQASKSS